VVTKGSSHSLTFSWGEITPIYLLKDSKPTDKVAEINEAALNEEIGKAKRRLTELLKLKERSRGPGYWYDEDNLRSLRVPFKVKRLVVKRA